MGTTITLLTIIEVPIIITHAITIETKVDSLMVDFLTTVNEETTKKQKDEEKTLEVTLETTTPIHVEVSTEVIQDEITIGTVQEEMNIEEIVIEETMVA